MGWTCAMGGSHGLNQHMEVTNQLAPCSAVLVSGIQRRTRLVSALSCRR